MGQKKPPMPWEPETDVADLEDFCLQIGIGRKGRLFLRAGLTPRQYFGRLIVHNLISDAIRFQAHALSKRNAVWWACLCLKSATDPTAKPKQAEAFKAVIRWVLEPNDANRRAAETVGKSATFSTSVGCIAMSVFWSGGGFDPLLTANTLSVAFPALAAEGDPTKVTENLLRFLALGIGVAKGQYPWVSPEEEKAERAGAR